MEKSAQQVIIEFAQSFESVLGTEKTMTLMQNLTSFANQCPETVLEIAEQVEENPKIFGDLLTPKGVAEAKAVIEQVKTYIPLMEAFAN